MHWDIWYDLAVLELSELSDPAKGKLVEAEKQALEGLRAKHSVKASLRHIEDAIPERVRDAVVSHKTSYDIRRISTESSGLVTLLEDGIVKAATGETSRKPSSPVFSTGKRPCQVLAIARPSG